MLHDIKSYTQIFFFLNLVKPGRFDQYLTGTGSGKNDRIDRNRISGRTLGHPKLYILLRAGRNVRNVKNVRNVRNGLMNIEYSSPILFQRPKV